MASSQCSRTRCTFEVHSMQTSETKIEIRNLTMAYGSYVVMRDINAQVKRGSVFVIMGNSGSGKSTLLRHMLGLQRPAQGDVLYDGRSFWNMDDEARRFGPRNGPGPGNPLLRRTVRRVGSNHLA